MLGYQIVSKYPEISPNKKPLLVLQVNSHTDLEFISPVYKFSAENFIVYFYLNFTQNNYLPLIMANVLAYSELRKTQSGVEQFSVDFLPSSFYILCLLHFCFIV